MINIIVIVRDVLFIIWLFWKIQMVMDGLRYFQVSLKSVQNQFRSFGPLSSQWNLLALVCSNISRLTLFSNTMLHITTFTISEHDFITFLKPNCLMIGRRFIGPAYQTQFLLEQILCWARRTPVTVSLSWCTAGKSGWQSNQSSSSNGSV